MSSHKTAAAGRRAEPSRRVNEEIKVSDYLLTSSIL